eukprot:2852891-Prymnesium_polylepis.1
MEPPTRCTANAPAAALSRKAPSPRQCRSPRNRSRLRLLRSRRLSAPRSSSRIIRDLYLFSRL